MTAVAAATLSIPQQVLDEVSELAAAHSSLQRVVQWGLAQTPAQLVLDVVKQDEFTQDVVIAYRDGYYLVYDCT